MGVVGVAVGDVQTAYHAIRSFTAVTFNYLMYTCHKNTFTCLTCVLTVI